MKIVCDETNNTPSDVAEGRVNVRVQMAVEEPRDTMTLAEMQRAIEYLEKHNAPVRDGYYVVSVHPNHARARCFNGNALFLASAFNRSS